MRAYAVLMMLQGHFTDTMLANEYRSYESAGYAFWAFFRGMTAPIFFFSAGLIFIFLLLKDGRPWKDNERVQKGIRRAFLLIGIGYLLRININALIYFDYFKIEHYPAMFGVDVLHCMGLALLALLGTYALHRYTLIPLPRLLAFFGLAIFFAYPTVKAADWSWLPMPIAAYFDKSKSVFTVVPWLGFSLLGGILGYHLHKRPQMAFSNWLPVALVGGGFLLRFYSTKWLKLLHVFSGWDNFMGVANNNFLFVELGHACIVAGIIMFITPRWKNMPALVTKIGSETLTIYTAHYILLYGAIFGIGLAKIWRRSFSPIECIIGAALFVVFFILVVKHIEWLRGYWNRYLVRNVDYIGKYCVVHARLAWHRLVIRPQGTAALDGLVQEFKQLRKAVWSAIRQRA